MAGEGSSIVVCDAGPLIHLEELGRIDLLLTFARICVPDTVWEEVRLHRPSALRKRRVKLIRVVDLQQPTPELRSLLQTFALDAGEAAAFRLMQEIPNATLLTDDSAARLLAVRMGYDVHGTIGVILRGMRHGLRTKRRVLTCFVRSPSEARCILQNKFLTPSLGKCSSSEMPPNSFVLRPGTNMSSVVAT